MAVSSGPRDSGDWSSEGRSGDYIETVWGRGYMLREPTEADERLNA
jgi:two-component system cell cycle response regulator CtrA